jgi:acyl-CoA oxidase
LTTIRVDAVVLVDSFNIPDVVLNSPLGCYDGRVYSRYFETVRNAPGAIGVPSYWKTLIQPMLDFSTLSSASKQQYVCE